VTYPGAVGVSRGYDDAGRWTSVQDWLGNSTTFGYDPDGNLTSRTLPATTGVVDSTTFNAAEQLASISDVKGATTVFAANYGRDAMGQMATDSSVASSVGSARYTTLNQLCYAGSANGNACSSPPSGAQAYAFDAADNLTGNRGATQAFNNADQLCWSVSGSSANTCASPPTGSTRYAYDSRGNRTTVTPSTGSATTLAFNLANELKSWTQGSVTATYAYDGDGLRMSKVVGGATTRFTWDVSGKLPLLVSDGATMYVYGPGNQLVEQLSANSGISLVGTASASGKKTSLTLTFPGGTKAGDEIYLASTQPSTTTVTAPSGYATVTSVTSSGSSPLAKLTVFKHLVAVGETSVVLSYSTQSTTQAALLAVYRGVDTGLPVDVFSSGSAAAGTSVTGPSVTTNYIGEQLLAFQGATGTFASTATWGAATGMSERSQVNPGSTSTGVADQGLGAAGATGTRISTFASANLATIVIGVPVRPVLYVHEDHLGTIRALTDGIGAVRGTFTYDPFGNLTASSGDSTSTFGYASEYRDTESALTFLRARYYDPATGQFINRDALVTSTRQPYGYASGNPINASDPSGLWCGAIDLSAIAWLPNTGASSEIAIGLCSNGDLYVNTTTGQYQAGQPGNAQIGVFGSGGLGVQASSNADCAAQLGGLFHQNFAGIGYGQGVTLSSSSGNGVHVETASFPRLPGVSAGAGFSEWETDTSVHSWNPIQAVGDFWNWLTH
jgi:RHS repeat-associated protein